MDYRKYLGQSATEVLPFLGGTSVVGAGRRLRVAPLASGQPPELGWWSFEVTGRRAVPQEAVAPPDLSTYESFRGHLFEDWCFAGANRYERVFLVPEAEPEPLAPCVARRWHGGPLLFDSLEFEQEAESAVREALEANQDISQVKGVGASLRAAFAFALLARTAQRRELCVSPLELHGRWLEVAERGMLVVDELLADLVEQRRLEAERRRNRELNQVAGAAVHHAVQRSRRDHTVQDRVEAALSEANAELISTRRLGEGQVEVTFRFMGERFASIVDARTLNVHDAGICLSGADREVTLESLPSVIREAIDTGALYITRHV